MRQGLYHLIVSTFLIWHFAGIGLWLCPPNPLQERLVEPFIWYVNFFGLWQNWSVFIAPRTVNYYMSALITFKDGTQRDWEFPRMEKMGILEKMYKERFRQWGTDAVSDDSMPLLRPDAARFIARLHYKNPSNPPVAIALIRHWTNIPPPEDGLGKPMKESDDGQQIIYQTEVSPSDL
jgi:hypothetical protein